MQERRTTRERGDDGGATTGAGLLAWSMTSVPWWRVATGSRAAIAGGSVSVEALCVPSGGRTNGVGISDLVSLLVEELRRSLPPSSPKALDGCEGYHLVCVLSGCCHPDWSLCVQHCVCVCVYLCECACGYMCATIGQWCVWLLECRTGCPRLRLNCGSCTTAMCRSGPPPGPCCILAQEPTMCLCAQTVTPGDLYRSRRKLCPAPPSVCSWSAK